MSFWKKLKKAATKTWNKVKNTVKKVVRIVKEIVHRVLGILDLIGSLLGIRPRKYLRLQILILRENGTPVLDPKLVMPWLAKATELFDKRLNVSIRPPRLSGQIIDVLREDAPAEALDAPGYSIGAGFGDAADYFEDQCHYFFTSAGSAITDFLGYGEPVYAFVVRSIKGSDAGTVYWFGQRYCVVSRDAAVTTLAHELGHNCGALHWESSGNLMAHAPAKRGACDLNRLQIAWIRDSRFVVFAPRRG